MKTELVSKYLTLPFGYRLVWRGGVYIGWYKYR